MKTEVCLTTNLIVTLNLPSLDRLNLERHQLVQYSQAPFTQLSAACLNSIKSTTVITNKTLK